MIRPCCWLAWGARLAALLQTFAPSAVAGGPLSVQKSFDNFVYSQWIADQERMWQSALPLANRACGGIAMGVVSVPHGPGLGDPVTLIVSIKNLNCRTVTLGLHMPHLLMRDASGVPVPLTPMARKEWLSFKTQKWSVPEEIEIAPGCAIAAKVPLKRYFEVTRPGRYSALVGCVGWTQFDFEVGGGTGPSPGLQSEVGAKPVVEGDPLGPEFPRGPQRRKAAAIPVRPHSGLVLEALLSPVDPRKVDFAVSLRNACVSAEVPAEMLFSFDASYGREDGVPIPTGMRASDYRILVRDVTGAAVPMTDEGRRWLTDQGVNLGRPLRPGEAVGFVFPIDKMFALRSGQAYTAVALLPGTHAGDPGWAAPRVRFRAPETVVAGVNRPPYGSDRMWEKLLPRAGLAAGGLVLRDTILCDAKKPWVRSQLDNASPEAIPWRGWPVYDVVLVRDGDGNALLPNTNAGAYWPSWSRFGAAQEVPPHAHAADSSFRAEYVFPFQSGSRYSVLHAVNLTRDMASGPRPGAEMIGLAVAGPVVFSVPVSMSTCSGFSPSRCSGGPTGVPPRDGDGWRLSIRFAGKPFEGLLLQASAGAALPAPAEALRFKVSVDNRSNGRITVTKWKGESDYEILIRDAVGKPVGMTETGKKFFAGGTLLDIRELKPGEYTVLASLPVVGDVDAILTAAPLKIQVK